MLLCFKIPWHAFVLSSVPQFIQYLQTSSLSFVLLCKSPSFKVHTDPYTWVTFSSTFWLKMISPMKFLWHYLKTSFSTYLISGIHFLFMQAYLTSPSPYKKKNIFELLNFSFSPIIHALQNMYSSFSTNIKSNNCISFCVWSPKHKIVIHLTFMLIFNPEKKQLLFSASWFSRICVAWC